MRTNDLKEQFIQKFYCQDSKLHEAIRAKAIQNKCDHMILAPSEARTLQFLVASFKPQKILEIGCLYGMTALKMAEAQKECGVDPHVWTLEKNPENAQIAQEFFNLSEFSKHIFLKTGDAQKLLEQINTSFDFIFIDADKSAYPFYLNWAYQNLKSRGVVVCDNTFLGGSVWGEEIPRKSQTQIKAMLDVHKELSDTTKWISHTLPSFDGLTVGIKK